LEKEARLEQIGFFRKFPRPEVVEAVVGQDVNNKKTTDGIVVVGTGSSTSCDGGKETKVL